MPLLEKEAKEMVEDWNGHKIRNQKGKNRPGGVPNDLYEFPEIAGTCMCFISYV